MGILKDLFAKGSDDVLEGAANLVGEFKDMGSKRKFQTGLATLLADRDARIEKNLYAFIKEKIEFMKVELVNGDAFTRRLRPTVGYAGLVYMLIEILAHIFVDGYTTPEIGHEFLYVWAGLMGVYKIMRSVDKKSGGNKLSNAVTGSDGTGLDKFLSDL